MLKNVENAGVVFGEGPEGDGKGLVKVGSVKVQQPGTAFFVPQGVERCLFRLDILLFFKLEAGGHAAGLQVAKFCFFGYHFFSPFKGSC